MSYDLAVWEGERPADNVAVGEAFTRYSCYIAVDEGFQPSPCIAEYVAGLLARWVDCTEAKERTFPWPTGSLTRDAAGPFTTSRSATAWPKGLRPMPQSSRHRWDWLATAPGWALRP